MTVPIMWRAVEKGGVVAGTWRKLSRQVYLPAMVEMGGIEAPVRISSDPAFTCVVYLLKFARIGPVDRPARASRGLV